MIFVWPSNWRFPINDNFSDANIEAYQNTVDSIFHKWLQLTGYDGLTSYIHMVGAGHKHFYLRKRQNLNRYQIQDWEACNR
jgi:hypothetical protein